MQDEGRAAAAAGTVDENVKGAAKEPARGGAMQGSGRKRACANARESQWMNATTMAATTMKMTMTMNADGGRRKRMTMRRRLRKFLLGLLLLR